MLNIVSVCNGTKYPDIYVDRLYSMVSRNLSTPFIFHCFTDRLRELNPQIVQHSIADWGLSGWFAKLRLFDGDTVDFDSFLYLDITLIVKSSLEPILKYVADKPFVALQDWRHDTFNSCIMWITRHPINQYVWDSYASGRKYETHYNGDQDYIHATFRERGLLDEVDYFPNGWILSYKRLRELHSAQPKEAEKALANAIILKFHGHPKPHELLLPRWESVKLRLQNTSMLLRNWSYLKNEISEWWI